MFLPLLQKQTGIVKNRIAHQSPNVSLVTVLATVVLAATTIRLAEAATVLATAVPAATARTVALAAILVTAALVRINRYGKY